MIDKKLILFFYKVADEYNGYFMFSFIDDSKLRSYVRDFVTRNTDLFLVWGKGGKTSPVIIQLKCTFFSKLNLATKKTSKASTFAKAIDNILVTITKIEKANGNLVFDKYYVDSRINSTPTSIPEDHVIITTKKRMTDLRQIYPNNSFYIPKHLECFYF